MGQDYGIFAVTDQETFAYILMRASAEGYDDFIIDEGDNGKMFLALGINEDDELGEDDCAWDGGDILILTRSTSRAFQIEKLLQKECNRHSHRNQVIVISDDPKPFEPFDPSNIVEVAVTEDQIAYQIMPSLPALRALGSADPEELFWEELDSIVMNLSD